MFNRISREPVAFWGLVTGGVEAVLGLLLVFMIFEPTAPQTGSILLLLAVLGSFLTFFVRRQTTPIVDPTDKAGNALVPAPTGGTVPPPPADDGF